MAKRSYYGRVGELGALADGAQHEPSTTHVTTANELRWKHKPIAQNSQEGFYILRCCDTSEKNNLALCSYSLREMHSITFKRLAVSGVGGTYRNARHVF